MAIGGTSIETGRSSAGDDRRGPAYLTLVIAGLIAVATLWAVFDHLVYAIEADAVRGRDLHLHLIDYLAVARLPVRPAAVVEAYQTKQARSIHHPPLAHIATAVLRRLTGARLLDALYGARAIWIAILAAAMFGAGRRTGRSAWAGLAAVSIAVLNAEALERAQEISLEYPAMAATGLVLWGWSRCPSFARAGGCAVLGACCGIAALSKTITVIFIAPLLVLSFLFVRGSETPPLLRRVRCGVVAAAATLIVAGWFYVSMIPWLGSAIGAHHPTGGAIWWSQFVVFVSGLRCNLSPLLIVLLAATGVIGIVRRDRVIAVLFVSSLLSIAWVATFQTAYAQPPAYLYPLLPVAGVLVARGLGILGRPRIAAVASVCLAAVTIVPVAASHFGWRVSPAAATRPPLSWLSPEDAAFSGRSRPGVPADDPLLGIDWERYELVSHLLAGRYREFDWEEMAILGYGVPMGVSDIHFAIEQYGRNEYMMDVAAIIARPDTPVRRSADALSSVYRCFDDHSGGVPSDEPDDTSGAALLWAFAPQPLDGESLPQHILALEREIKRSSAYHRLDLVIDMPAGLDRRATLSVYVRRDRDRWSGPPIRYRID